MHTRIKINRKLSFHVSETASLRRGMNKEKKKITRLYFRWSLPNPSLRSFLHIYFREELATMNTKCKRLPTAIATAIATAAHMLKSNESFKLTEIVPSFFWFSSQSCHNYFFFYQKRDIMYQEYNDIKATSHTTHNR